LRVLIAEDDSLVAEVIRAEVLHLGHEIVAHAPDGRRAVELVCSLKPDIVLMDIQMPVLGGIEACRAIQECCPTPIVIVTAHTEGDVPLQAAQAGAGAYLVKPAAPEEVERAILIARARFADLLELKRVNAELRDALAHVKTLTGLLPICCHCKKIRDDEGYWSQVEEYLTKRIEVDFTHGICPECIKQYYGSPRRKADDA